jgi:hypothetical protein
MGKSRRGSLTAGARTVRVLIRVPAHGHERYGEAEEKPALG